MSVELRKSGFWLIMRRERITTSSSGNHVQKTSPLHPFYKEVVSASITSILEIGKASGSLRPGEGMEFITSSLPSLSQIFSRKIVAIRKFLPHPPHFKAEITISCFKADFCPVGLTTIHNYYLLDWWRQPTFFAS